MFQPLWMFVDQQEETQMDFFDLCEDIMDEKEIGLESQTEGSGGDNDQKA